ncbi:MAG: OmpA family protein [Angustibacter sp.]
MLAGLSGATVVLTALAPPSIAQAMPTPPAPITSVTVGGAPAASVAAGDRLDVVTDSPISATGAVAQTVTRTWDPASAHLAPSSVIAPEGWPVEYRVDGSWSSSVPADLATTSGVRASSTVRSGGGDGAGHQILTTDAGGSLKAGISSFSGSGGGDGWNVFFAGPKVLNVFHHNMGTYALDCHLRDDGSSCGDVYRVNGYTTSGASSGSVVGTKVYSVVGADTSAGVICTDTATSPFTPCGYTPLISGNFSYFANIGEQAMVAGRVYATVTDGSSGFLLCYDTATGAACPEQPTSLAGYSPSDTVPAYAMAISGKVFVSASQVWCFDGATGAACPGTWPTGSSGWIAASVIPMRASNGDGTLTGVCSIRGNRECFDLTGSPVAVPPGLSGLLDYAPAESMGSWSDFVAATATKQYWISGGPVTCYDWTTDAPCSGFAGADTGGDRYSVVVDPADERCLWTNGDSGVIRPVNGLTGQLGCPPPADPVVVLPYTAVAPRTQCADGARVLAWQSMTVNPPSGLARSSLRLTVRDAAGAQVPSYTGLVVPDDGVIDLSGLAVSATGQGPSLELTALGADSALAADVRADVRYTAPAPQLCLSLQVQHQCPTLAAGQQPGDTVPVSDLALPGSATTVAEATVSTDATTSVTRAATAGCLGRVTGSVDLSPASGAVPLSGAGVSVLSGSGPGATTYATATTDGTGTYSVGRLSPGTYTVRSSRHDQQVTVAADASVTADISVSVTAPVAHHIHIVTLLDTPGTAPAVMDVDGRTTVDAASVRIHDPRADSWVSHLVVVGEGTWDVTGDGSLRFTPAHGFAGGTAAVTYRAADGWGVTAQAQANALVAATPPSAHPVRATTTQGLPVTLRPDGVSPDVPLDPASLSLLDGAGHRTDVVSVDRVGRFTVNRQTGTVTFAPVPTFTGTRSVVYQVADRLDRTASSTLTVTVSAVRPSVGAVTIRAGQTAFVTLRGLPASATVAVPGRVPGATAVSATRTRLRVVTPVTTSGVLRIPVTVRNGSAVFHPVAYVRVLPAAAVRGSYTLSNGGTTASWRRSPTTSVVGYRVLVNGHEVCATTRTHCTGDLLAGPRSTVVVVAVGRGGTRSSARHLRYVRGQALHLTDVYFASNSAALSRTSRTALQRACAKITRQGFTTVTMIGYTDSYGNSAYNLSLSKRRVSTTGGFLKSCVRGLQVRSGAFGERNPTANNSTAAGRAKNRRVEIRVS